MALQQLQHAKQESDRGNYRKKRQILRELLGKDPAAFQVDQPGGKYQGLTHTPTGFQIHTDRRTASLAKG